MSPVNDVLLIPVENQVREFDPKLLLACVAARKGFTSIIGSRREMELNIDAFPRATYLSKSMTIRSLPFFQVARRLGHTIVAWDEEALVHLPPSTYFSRRLNPLSLRHVTTLFAWGEANRELWRQYPRLPGNIAIHAIGNPRGDMLRPEMGAFYAADVQALRDVHGPFILLNTNFNHVNAFGPDLNLFRSGGDTGKRARFGRAARGMSRDYARGLWQHKRALQARFIQLIPVLERCFPDMRIIVRPHPTESHDVYRRAAAGCDRVQVINKGNIVPWLMACNLLVHNGCTTGVEAHILGVPAISYRAAVNDLYDHGFYHLPNSLSHECFSFDELRCTAERILDGNLGIANGTHRQDLIDRHLASQEGALACEQIVDVLEQGSARDRGREDAAGAHLQRSVLRAGLHLARTLKAKLPGTHNLPEFQRHRYPEISIDEVRNRLSRFQDLLGDSSRLTVERLTCGSFRISRRTG